jgi:tRNA/rRNA methyltransferase
MNRLSNLERINIVLVEPSEAGNIGSVCRAMKTMGIKNLSVTGSKEYDESRIKSLAVHAYDVWENCNRYSSLKEAVEKSILIVGASRRRGKNRKYFSINPDQLIERLENTGSGTISIVFGNEAAGLTDAELKLCHLSLKIETSDDFPSLNLAQAVQIVTYTLFSKSNSYIGFEQIDENRLNNLVANVSKSLTEIDFYKLNEKYEVENLFHDIFARATLSEREAQRLERIFYKIEKIKIHKNNDKEKLP